MQTTMIPKFIDSDRTGYKYMIKVSGFKGGHSGQDINLGRANAIRVMTRLLSELKDFKLISLSGGSAINTIPRECEATIFLSEDKEKSFLQTFNHLTANFSSEFPLENPVFDLQKISSEDKQYKVMVKSDQDDLLSTLGKLPDGVIQMESINKKMVRTSNNIGSIKMQGDTVLTSMLFRSSSNLQIDSVKKVIELICIGKKTEMLFRLPPWEPHFDIELIKTAVATYENIFHKKLEVKTVHGGLECSIFYEKISGAQIISFGPSVSRAHTPDECVHIPSVQMFWNFLLASIK